MSKDDEDLTTRGAGAAFLRHLREPMLVTKPSGSLSVACPVCRAGVGVRCRAVRRTAKALDGKTWRKAHRERVVASRGEA